jgi:serine/threonine protein kinase
MQARAPEPWRIIYCSIHTWTPLTASCARAQGGTVASMLLQQEVNPWRRVYSLADALRWCVDVAGAVVALHSAAQPMIHRDLKLENVLLTKADGETRAAITDFGLTAVRRVGTRVSTFAP